MNYNIWGWIFTARKVEVRKEEACCALVNVWDSSVQIQSELETLAPWGEQVIVGGGNCSCCCRHIFASVNKRSLEHLEQLVSHVNQHPIFLPPRSPLRRDNFPESRILGCASALWSIEGAPGLSEVVPSSVGFFKRDLFVGGWASKRDNHKRPVICFVPLMRCFFPPLCHLLKLPANIKLGRSNYSLMVNVIVLTIANKILIRKGFETKV